MKRPSRVSEKGEGGSRQGAEGRESNFSQEKDREERKKKSSIMGQDKTIQPGEKVRFDAI